MAQMMLTGSKAWLYTTKVEPVTSSRLNGLTGQIAGAADIEQLIGLDTVIGRNCVSQGRGHTAIVSRWED